MSLNILSRKKEGLKSELTAILSKIESEDRIMTAEERASFEAKKAELDEVKAQIDLLQGFDSAEPQAAVSSLAAAKVVVGQPPALSGKKEFDSLNDFMAAVLGDHNDPRLADCYREPKSQQNMGTGAAGGFAVPKQFITEIKSVDPTAALVRPRASVIPAGSPPDAEISFPALDQEPTGAGVNQVYAGVEVKKVEEGGLKHATSFNLREISLKPKEVAARIPFTDKLMRNWQAASSWGSDLLRRAVTGWEDHQFLTGNGVGGPEGVIDAPATYAVARAVANQVAFADIKEMYTRFRGDEGRAVWVTSPSTFTQFLNMVGDGGGATNVINVNQATGSVTVYGIPLMRHPRMRALGFRGDVGLFDLQEYLIKDGSGPIVEVGFAYLQWESNQRSIKITFNVDGKPWMTRPYRDEDNFEVSPFVVLDLPGLSD
jgi:HK97 family phage major capsid protein